MSEEDPTKPTAAMLKKWYEDPKDPHHDDALHMLAKFLIQGIRARGIFKDEKDNKGLSDARKAYESYKYCVYNKIFGTIDHADLTYDIVHKEKLDDDDKKKLEDMITEMVKFYKSQPIKYPSMSKSFIPYVEPSCSDTPTDSLTLTPNARTELHKRLRHGPMIPSKEHKNQNSRANTWYAIFTVIFESPSFTTQGFHSSITSVIGVEPVGTITFRKSGGKSTRRARTKKARRAKRHTRRAARREYRAR
jgi:hypothetical protein